MNPFVNDNFNFMALRKDDWYRIKGISLVLFILAIFVLFEMPKCGINPILFNAEQIDSGFIVSYPNVSHKFIIIKPDIRKIASALRKSTALTLKGPKGCKKVYEIWFYSHKDRYILDLYNCDMDGRIIVGNQIDYKNDSIWDFIDTSYLKLNSCR